MNILIFDIILTLSNDVFDLYVLKKLVPSLLKWTLEKIVCIIEIGAFGYVYQAEEKQTGKYYAVKVIDYKGDEDECSKVINPDCEINEITDAIKRIMQNFPSPFSTW